MSYELTKCVLLGLLLGLLWFLPNGWGDEIHLKNGDILEGTVKRRTTDLVLFEHGDLGDIWISRQRVVKIVISRDGDPNSLPKGFFPKLKYWGWENTFDFSIDNSFGNTDEQSNRFAYAAKRSTEKGRLDIDSSYYYKIKSGKNTDNKWTLGSTYRWLKSDTGAYWFAMGRYDYDEFKSWIHRGSTHTGPGYFLVDSNSVTLTADAGLGARKESGSFNDNWKFEGTTGFDFLWRITGRQTFDLGMHYTPVLTDTADYRTRTSMNWRISVDREANLSLLMGILHEYQSVVDPDVKKDDLRMFLGLQFSF
ncbi:DUF481 domain-containing protein [Planctomycetota bacterium]